jgi:hypothetical protein
MDLTPTATTFPLGAVSSGGSHYPKPNTCGQHNLTIQTALIQMGLHSNDWNKKETANCMAIGCPQYFNQYLILIKTKSQDLINKPQTNNCHQKARGWRLLEKVNAGELMLMNGQQRVNVKTGRFF